MRETLKSTTSVKPDTLPDDSQYKYNRYNSPDRQKNKKKGGGRNRNYDHGKPATIYQIGATTELSTNDDHRFVKEWVGDSPMKIVLQICPIDLNYSDLIYQNLFQLMNPQRFQVCQEIQTTKLKSILVSWSAKIQSKSKKLWKTPSKLNNKCQRNPVSEGFLNFIQFGSNLSAPTHQSNLHLGLLDFLTPLAPQGACQ